jgi:hypothetical protein
MTRETQSFNEGAFRLLSLRAHELARAALHMEPVKGVGFVTTTERVFFNGVRYDAHVSVELVQVL